MKCLPPALIFLFLIFLHIPFLKKPIKNRAGIKSKIAHNSRCCVIFLDLIPALGKR